jgi:hypothetical protein
MSNNNTENIEDLKVFTFRNIPEELNKNWKLAAAIEGITKEELGARWLKESCNNYFIALAASGRSLGLGLGSGSSKSEDIDSENDNVITDIEITAENLKID